MKRLFLFVFISYFFTFSLLAKESVIKLHKLSEEDFIRYGFFYSNAESIQSNTLIIFLQGLESFIEKNKETYFDLNDKGYDVFTFDWRSQGGSSRFIKDQAYQQRVHIPNFDIWLNDLDQLLQCKKLKNYENIVLMGISMGGHIALRYLLENKERNNLPFKAAIFIAPMIDIKTFHLPYAICHPIIKFMSWLDPIGYVLGHNDYDFSEVNPIHQKSTTDLVRAVQTHNVCLENPDFVTAGPTWHFLDEMISSIRYTHTHPKVLEDIPSLWILAGQDHLIDNNRIYEFLSAQNADIELYPHAKHNIIRESDPIRTDLLEKIDTFIESQGIGVEYHEDLLYFDDEED